MIELIADTDDDELAFALYDPAALGDVRTGEGDWEQKREQLAAKGRAALHVALPRIQSPDHPGTERRIARVLVDEPIPDEWADRARCVVDGSRLQVPSGQLYFAGVFAMRGDGVPTMAGERYGAAAIDPGDYRLDIHLADWADGERERFVEERLEPRDRAFEHRLGCLGMWTIASTVVAPLALVFGYFGLPLVSDARLPSNAWSWVLGVLAVLWLAVFGLNKAPSQRRILAARSARDARMLPTIFYRLTTDAPGSRPAFYHEEAQESAGVRRRYGLGNAE